MFDGRDTIVMFDKLAYEDLLPVRWRPQSETVSEVMAAQHLVERNLRVLQACDALEEHGQTEKSDDESPHSADLMRLDFKLNLLLDLAGQLLAASQPRAAPGADPLQRHGRDLEVRRAAGARRARHPRDHAARPDRAAAEPAGGSRAPARRTAKRACVSCGSAKRSPITSRSWCFAATGERLPARVSSARRAENKFAARKIH